MNSKRISKIYTNLAVIVFNTLLFFVCINLSLWAYSWTDDDFLSQPTEVAGYPLEVYELRTLEGDFDRLRRVYYYLTDGEIIWLVLESSNLPIICDDRTFFRQAPYQGRYFQIDTAGFRWGDAQAPWPPDENKFNIFVFGGSTTLGQGVPANLTLSSYLQYDLRQALGSEAIAVYNFGQGFFYSFQERLLFESLIEDGFVPDLAIFIDGLNDFILWDGKPNPEYIRNCSRPLAVSERLYKTLACHSGEVCLPIQKLALSFEQAHKPIQESQQSTVPIPALDDMATARAIIQRWLDNKQQIEELAQQRNISLLFVMQPVPMYAYDLRYHLFMSEADAKTFRHYFGYPIWDQMYQEAAQDWAVNVINLTHLGEDNQGPLYVDGFHYTSDFMGEMALAISDRIVALQLVR